MNITLENSLITEFLQDLHPEGRLRVLCDGMDFVVGLDRIEPDEKFPAQIRVNGLLLQEPQEHLEKVCLTVFLRCPKVVQSDYLYRGIEKMNQRQQLAYHRAAGNID